MFPLWDLIVAPVLEAAGVQRLVEIGALRGENTRQILDRLGPSAELHVIDPLPDFDPVEHAKQFAGQYIFHRDLSLHVLGQLPPMDAALIDGDHNWYTVYNELRLLAETSRAHEHPLPVCVLHDVAWPYGRRDLYYDPDNIPEEHRQPWRRAGMRPGRKALLPRGGLNPTLANAEKEGGKHNGVMTGVDDFVASYDRPLRTVVVPIYFGLAIVVEEERLARQPDLASVLDHIESRDGKHELLELGEAIRIDGMIFQHNIFFRNEAAIDRLAGRFVEAMEAGLDDGDEDRRADLDRLHRVMDTVRTEHVLGDLVHIGSRSPSEAAILRGYIDAHDMSDRTVWASPEASKGLHDVLARYGLSTEQTGILSTDDASEPGRIALLHLGAGLDADTVGRALSRLSHRLSPGAFVVIEHGDATPPGLPEGGGNGRTTAVDLGPSVTAWRTIGTEPAVAPSA
jgi:hypothetical protein